LAFTYPKIKMTHGLSLDSSLLSDFRNGVTITSDL